MRKRINMINRKTISECRIYDEKYRCWDNTPLMIYPNQQIVKQDRIIQWYTGVIDKNGKKIYEGDVVKTIDSGMGVLLDAPKYTRGVITWLRESFCLCQSYVGGTELSNYVFCDCCGCGLIVIGNIFDNPELLEDDTVVKQLRDSRKDL